MGFSFYLSVFGFVLALTPVERWKAASRFDTYFIGRHWFVLTAVAAIIILIVLLLVVSLRRMAQEQKLTDRLFLDCAERRGLSRRERQILLDIAGKAGVKQSNAIFTMGKAFDRGATKMIEEELARQGAEESGQLRGEVSFLREKLGFQKQYRSSIGSATKPRERKPSSRQIPVGRKVHITRRRARFSDDIEAIVTKNNEMELAVKPTMPVKVTSGEFWRVRYYFGASVWEFDTSVVDCVGDVLVLNHSDNVRFINRRRFLRVPVNKPAFVAHFPFARTLPPDSDGSEEGSKTRQGLANASGSSWRPPEFVPAVVTELAGPGLRIEVPLEVKVGDRVLVVLRLDEEGDQDSGPSRRDGEAVKSEIVEDIGEVRHTRAIRNGLSIAVELTGLSDSDVNELIRATNLASRKAGTESQGVRGAAEVEKGATEPAAVQGI
ncbi:MAG: PilZ domain-containing protein [Planctomycetota bacterium]